jgi:hypothetical protein
MNIVQERKFLVSISETTNAGGRKVTNVVIGVFKNNQTLSQNLFFSAMPGNL